VPADRLLALAHVGEEVRAARAVLVQFVALEVAPQDAQDLVLRGRHPGVVDHLRLAQQPQPVLEGLGLHLLHGFLAAAQVHQRLDVDVDRVERQAAGRAVGTGGGGVVREQGVQRAQADERRALVGRGVAEPPQVAEVADAPVARGAQGIELDRATPPPLPLLQFGGDVAGPRGDDDAAELRGRRSLPA
jgi:hypothetical protein